MSQVYGGNVRTPEGVANARARARATSRALWRLRELHQRQYRRLFEQELAEENVTALKHGRPLRVVAPKSGLR